MLCLNRLFICDWFWTHVNISCTSAQNEVLRQYTGKLNRGDCIDMCKYLVGPWAGSLQRFPLTWPQGCQRCQICISVLHLCQLQLLHLIKGKKERMCVWQALKNKIHISVGSPKSTRNVCKKKKKTESCYWWWIFNFSTIEFTDRLWQRTQVGGLCKNMLRAL